MFLSVADPARAAKRGLLPLVIGGAMVVIAWLILTGLASSPVDAAGAVISARFVDQAAAPIVGTVRVLCYATDLSGSPLADFVVVTDAAGQADLPADCQYVAALHLLHEQPSARPEHGPAYWAYATSWPPGATTPVTTTGDIVIRQEWPLVLFNVVASLTWEPAAGSPYLAELRAGLEQASAYLYDLTEGGMAFGPITIHTGGRHWEGADLRFLAANDLRPAAHVGGMVHTPTLYSSAFRSTVYNPAAVFLGRYWDGRTASNPITGTWAYPGAHRTLTHEWAHYALFLYDEYQQSGGPETYCTCNDLPEMGLLPAACGGVGPELAASAMAYHYTASELWSGVIHGAPAECISTDQWEMHGHSDWETLGIWPDIQSLGGVIPGLSAPPALTPGPELGLAAALFGSRPGYRVYLPVIIRGGDPPPPDAFEPTLEVYLDEAVLPADTFASHVYQLEDMATGSPGRVLHQGSVTGSPAPDSFLGEITLLGVGAADRTRILVDRYTTATTSGHRFIYASAEPFTSTSPIEVKAVGDDWSASLDAIYELSGSYLTTMTVVLTTPRGSDPMAQLCAVDAAVGCPPHWQQPMTLSGAASTETWTATFTSLAGDAELPLYFVLRVENQKGGELIRWIKDGGGVGPGHGDAHPPLVDGLATVKTSDPISGPEISGCNRVIIMPAANFDALSQPLAGLAGLVGTPLDLDILLPENQETCPQPAPGDHTLPLPVVLTLYYDQSVIDRLGITDEKNQLELLHFVRDVQGKGRWSVVDTSNVSQALNWIAGSVIEDGIYAIGWVP